MNCNVKWLWKYNERYNNCKFKDIKIIKLTGSAILGKVKHNVLNLTDIKQLIVGDAYEEVEEDHSIGWIIHVKQSCMTYYLSNVNHSPKSLKRSSSKY